MEEVLTIRDARHSYGATKALDGAHLTVAAGECVALLGPNGAGKTTLVGLATGLLSPQGATRVRIAGADPRRAGTRRHLGIVQQSAGLPRTLKVRELVRGVATRMGLPAAAAGPVLAEVGLADLAGRRASRLSGGQEQRLKLAMALVGAPDLLLLDEPTVGLDLTARRAFWRTLAARRDRGAGILLTTHVVEEAAAVADRVVLLHRGRVVAEGSPGHLADRLPGRTITVRTSLDLATLSAMDGVAAATRYDGGLVRLGTDRAEEVLRVLLDRDPDLADLRIEGASLEQALLALTGLDVGANDTEEVAA